MWGGGQGTRGSRRARLLDDGGAARSSEDARARGEARRRSLEASRRTLRDDGWRLLIPEPRQCTFQIVASLHVESADSGRGGCWSPSSRGGSATIDRVLSPSPYHLSAHCRRCCQLGGHQAYYASSCETSPKRCACRSIPPRLSTAPCCRRSTCIAADFKRSCRLHSDDHCHRCAPSHRPKQRPSTRSAPSRPGSPRPPPPP